MKKIKILLLLGILCVCIASCQEAIETVVESSPTVDSVTSTPVQLTAVPELPKRTPTLLPLLTPTQAAWVVWTPQAPVPLSTAEANVENLLKTNGGCALPCWWGIEPSRTSFMTVFDQFSPLTTFIAVKKTDDMGSLDAEFRFPVSETNSNQELTITYKVVNGIIQLIEIYPGNINQFRFNQILKDYGDPEEVWVEGLIDPTSSNPFTIFFYYPRKGIIVTFWVDATDLGDMLQICPGSISPIILVLWEPDGFERFNDITGNTYGLAYIKKENRSLISLEQATDQTLAEISESNCFETPKKLWPSR